MLAETETRPSNAAAAIYDAVRAVDAAEANPTRFSVMVARLKVAESGWLDNADRTDEVKAENEGRTVTDEDRAAWEEASDAHWAAVDALSDYQPQTPSEALHKALLLTNNGDTRLRTEDHLAAIYLRDTLAWCQMRAEPFDAPSWITLMRAAGGRLEMRVGDLEMGVPFLGPTAAVAQALAAAMHDKAHLAAVKKLIRAERK